MKQIISINENELKYIVNESIRRVLKENMYGESITSKEVMDFMFSLGFKLYDEYEEGQNFLHFYYLNPGNDFREILYKVDDFLDEGNWTIERCGNHYDGLRHRYDRVEGGHVGTFFIDMEQDYGNPLTYDDMYNLIEEDKDKKKYIAGIFYHNTRRQFIESIMREGLKPMNLQGGEGITNWRSTMDRLYLSLVPDYEDSCNYDEEDPDDDDFITLKIDLRNYNGNIEFFEDYYYKNAVYTYSTIPASYIEIMRGGDESKREIINNMIESRINIIYERNPHINNRRVSLNNFNIILSHCERYDIDVGRGYYNNIMDYNEYRQLVIDKLREKINTLQ